MPPDQPAPAPLENPALLDRIHRLWDELAAFEASRNDEALIHLLATVAGMIDAQNAYWMGTVRVNASAADALLGWRPAALRYWQPLPDDTRFTTQRLRSINKGQVDESTVAQARLAGSFRAHRLRDIVSPAWFGGDFHQNYLARGIHDSLTVAAPANDMTECYYGFLRMRPDDPFTEGQRQIAYHALRGLAWFHRQVLLSHGLPTASAPLSPTERKVLAHLLTDLTEKEIAQTLGITPSTAHTYCRDVLRKLGVKGRSGLTALWLGRSAGK
jgi:DNA-binding CsgD family transcriptional regulator